MKKIISDSAFIGLSHFSIALLQLGLQVYAVRSTSLTAFGEFSFALAVTSLIEAIFVARSGELALQYVGKHWVSGDYNAARAYTRQLLFFDRIINWSLFFLVALFAYMFYKVFKFNLLYLLLLSLMLPAQIGYGIYKGMFISASKLKQQAIFETLFILVQTVTGIIGVHLIGIPGLIVALVCSSITKTMLARQITNRWWPADIISNRTLQKAKHLTNMRIADAVGFHSIVRNAFTNGANQIDILILNALRGPEMVALYKVAKTLAMLPVRFSGPLWSALRPRIMEAWYSGNKQQSLKLVVYPALILFTMLVVAAFPAYFFSDNVISLFYGTTYAAATAPFLILLIGFWFFGAMTAWFTFWVIISEERSTGILVYGLLFVVTFSLGIAFGGKSAAHMAIVVSASMLFAGILCWYIFLQSVRRLQPVNLGLKF